MRDWECRHCFTEDILFFFLPHHTACGISVPGPGIKLEPPALAACRLNYWPPGSPSRRTFFRESALLSSQAYGGGPEQSRPPTTACSPSGQIPTLLDSKKPSVLPRSRAWPWRPSEKLRPPGSTDHALRMTGPSGQGSERDFKLVSRFLFLQ